MSKFWNYFIFSVCFWFIVDFTTTQAIKNPGVYYSTYMPTILIFYLGFPLVFSYLIYTKEVSNKGIFIAMCIGIIIVEILFTNNPLFYTFPLVILAVFVSICIYGFLTFVPKWIVDGEIKANKGKMLFLSIIWILISFLTLVGTG